MKLYKHCTKSHSCQSWTTVSPFVKDQHRHFRLNARNSARDHLFSAVIPESMPRNFPRTDFELLSDIAEVEMPNMNFRIKRCTHVTRHQARRSGSLFELVPHYLQKCAQDFLANALLGPKLILPQQYIHSPSLMAPVTCGGVF